MTAVEGEFREKNNKLRSLGLTSSKKSTMTQEDILDLNFLYGNEEDVINSILTIKRYLCNRYGAKLIHCTL